MRASSSWKINVSAMSWCPNLTAQSLALLPSALLSPGSAPFISRAFTTSIRPFPAATISAVAPVAACAALTSGAAPTSPSASPAASSRSSNASSVPAMKAVIMAASSSGGASATGRGRRARPRPTNPRTSSR